MIRFRSVIGVVLFSAAAFAQSTVQVDPAGNISLSVTAPGGSDAPNQTYAGFVYTTDGATINGTTFNATDYYCVINNGGSTPTIAVTSVAAGAGTGHKFDIREDTTNSKWYFYIDGAQTCTSTTTLPTALLEQTALATTLNTTAKTLNFSWAELWSDK